MELICHRLPGKAAKIYPVSDVHLGSILHDKERRMAKNR